jgi:hypothetical protein
MASWAILRDRRTPVPGPGSGGAGTLARCGAPQGLTNRGGEPDGVLGRCGESLELAKAKRGWHPFLAAWGHSLGLASVLKEGSGADDRI